MVKWFRRRPYAAVSGEHSTAGTVTIYKLDDGTRVLRLTDFHTSYIAVGIHFRRRRQIDMHVGAINLGDFHCVSVWCARFHVNFGAAQLQ